jgi:hypothetical protein
MKSRAVHTPAIKCFNNQMEMDSRHPQVLACKNLRAFKMIHSKSLHVFISLPMGHVWITQ